MDETEENFWRGTRGLLERKIAAISEKFSTYLLEGVHRTFCRRVWAKRVAMDVMEVCRACHCDLPTSFEEVGSVDRVGASLIQQNTPKLLLLALSSSNDFCTIYSNQSRGESHTMQFNSDVRSDEENVLRNFLSSDLGRRLAQSLKCARSLTTWVR